jgi:ATP-dependent Clp protease ATP-binding subunit ClpC
MNMEEIEAQALSELRRLFNPEFINRVDDIVVFHPLDMKHIEAILDIEIADLSLRLAEQGFQIRVLAGARKILIEKGWDPKFGGRPLRRTIQKELEDALSRLILDREWPAGTVFTAAGKGGKIRIKGEAPAAQAAPAPCIEENVTAAGTTV